MTNEEWLRLRARLCRYTTKSYCSFAEELYSLGRSLLWFFFRGSFTSGAFLFCLICCLFLYVFRYYWYSVCLSSHHVRICLYVYLLKFIFWAVCYFFRSNYLDWVCSTVLCNNANGCKFEWCFLGMFIWNCCDWKFIRAH